MNVPNESPNWQEILEHLSLAWTPALWSDLGVVVGCSGGADSVALLRALVALRQQQRCPRGFLVVTHFNHGLRGVESDLDERFVRELAEQFQLRFHCRRGSGQVRDEATLRDQRMQFLLATAKRFGARYVAVAHTADDNVETVLHRLMRGTGPQGISGIAPARSLGEDFVLIRPLLATRRGQLRLGLREIQQSWQEDSSNFNTDYRRNWIRLELIPRIESEYPEAVAAVARAIEGQRQWRDTIDRFAAYWLAEHLVTFDEVILSRDTDADPSIVIAALQSLWSQKNWPKQGMARLQWTRLATTLRGSDRERYWLPAAIEVVAETDRVSIQRPRE